MTRAGGLPTPLVGPDGRVLLWPPHKEPLTLEVASASGPALHPGGVGRAHDGQKRRTGGARRSVAGVRRKFVFPSWVVSPASPRAGRPCAGSAP